MAKFTDEEMSYAAALAYLDFKQDVIDSHPDWTIGQHLESPLNADLKAQFMKRIGPDRYEDFISGSYQDWKLIDTQNSNSENGFCACTIDTGDGNAIVGFRGSEVNWLDLKLMNDDWVIADGGLINEIMTSQQEYAADYVKRIYDTYGDDYGNFSITGHSLGGNLAEHAALMAPDGMVDKMDRCLSFDGPGFSDEYLVEHADQIAKNAHKVDHYHASGVGAMFNPIPGTNYRDIEVKDGAYGFKRHNIKNFVFGEDGSVRSGKPDALSYLCNSITNTIDDTTTLPGALSIFEIIANLSDSDSDYGELLKETFKENLFKYGRDSRARAQAAVPANFKISSPILESASDTSANCKSLLSDYASEVANIKSDICLLLKAASLFTLSYKLGKSSSNLEKLANKAGKMGECGKSIVDLYTNTENNVVQNAGA